MYTKQCKTALNYIRPIIISKKYYKNRNLTKEIGTLIVLNKQGDILTTKEIAENIIISSEANDIFNEIYKELNSKKTNIKKIEKKYDLTDKTITNVAIQIIDVAESITNVEILFHKYLNLAIIKTNNKNLLVNIYPKLYKGNIQQGQSILGVGFPFPEYDAFEYDEINHKINITKKNMNFPSFPITAIVTRTIMDEENNISQFEISKEIYDGMQGGVILNGKNEMLGIISTNKIVFNKNETIKLGNIINTNEIIKFLEENNIEYNKSEKNEKEKIEN